MTAQCLSPENRPSVENHEGTQILSLLLRLEHVEMLLLDAERTAVQNQVWLEVLYSNENTEQCRSEVHSHDYIYSSHHNKHGFKLLIFTHHD